MNNLKSYARLKFITRTGNTLVVDDADRCIISVVTCKELSNPNGTFSIILSPRIAKQLSVSRGSLAISDIINPYDLVQIEFKVDDSGYHTEMIGLVSRASVAMSIGESGAPQRVIKIDGFDMGMALKNFKLFFSPFVFGTNFKQYGGKIVFGTDNHIFAGNNPKQFIQNFLTLAMGKFGQPGANQFSYPLTFPNGFKITNYMDFNTGISTAFNNNTMSDPFILTNIQSNTEQSVYDIVKFYSDIPYHEVFMDLRRPVPINGVVNQDAVDAAEKSHLIQPKAQDVNGNVFNPDLSAITGYYQPYVFNMRTCPFSRGSKGWDGLNYHDFHPSEVLKIDVSASEQNIFNYFDVICERQSFALGDFQQAFVSEQGKTTDSQGNLLVSRFPIQDNDSIQKYGIKRFPYHTTKYVEFISSANSLKKGETNQLPITQIRTLARQLFRWFSFGELFETGTIVMKGRVGVGPYGMTMGSKLREIDFNNQRTGKEYYIESVMQEFAIGQSLRTTCAVTRGHYPYGILNQSRKPLPTTTTGPLSLQGLTYPIVGRFNLEEAQEVVLNLDQANNSQYFNPLDAQDGVA
jgi:hypothetical protein